jgi:hypothetical protein
MVEKVISGGQTGADRMGLDVAKELGIPTGGTAPKNYRTENGPDWSLQAYGLAESYSYDYEPRTYQNAQDSTGTVIFGDTNSAGSKLTVKACKFHKKPYKANPSVLELVDWIRESNITILNVAGNRGSKLSGHQLEGYANTLFSALKIVNEL